MSIVTDSRDFGLPGFALNPGDHVCALYFGRTERDEIMLPYLRAGLRAGDKCLCLVDGTDPAEMAATIAGESAAGPEQLDVQRTVDVYLSSGRFSTELMIGFLDETMSAATGAGGYRFARVAGEMSWVLDKPPGAEELFAYETEINRFAPKHPQILMCMYDLDRFGGSILVDLLKTHPKLLLGGMVLDNPHYLSPDEFRTTR
jgi:hypothetical protein